jgi:hypothetical protein
MGYEVCGLQLKTSNRLVDCLLHKSCSFFETNGERHVHRQSVGDSTEDPARGTPTPLLLLLIGSSPNALAQRYILEVLHSMTQSSLKIWEDTNG